RVLAGIAVGPLAVVEAAGDGDPAALGEVLGAVLGELAEDSQVDIDGGLLLAVLGTAGDGEPHAGDLGVALGLAQLGVAGQAADEVDAVHGAFSLPPPAGGLGALTQPKTGANTAAERQPRRGRPNAVSGLRAAAG